MRIAITNSWPNLPESAEKEFLRRAAVAAKRISFDFREVVTSDDIERFKPDVVIASHEFTPKLTKYPTLGAMWSPSSLYCNDSNRLKSIFSYDGYLVGSELVAQFVEDLTFSTSKKPVLSDFLFLPSTYKIPGGKHNIKKYTLFYAGVHWDGSRHGEVFTALDEKKILNAYGPASSWEFLQNSYRGIIPFDGKTLFSLLSKHGVALCLHKDAHRQYNTPSMRLFEAAASGSVIISDDFPFVREYFGDSVLYLPPFESGSKVIADCIASHMNWINSNPKQAAEMANTSREIFDEKLSLEKMFSKLPAFVDQVKQDMGLTVSKSQKKEKSVQYIVRIGSRPKDMIRRCLDSLAKQTYTNIHLILVSYRQVNGIDVLIKEYDSIFRSIKYVEVADSGFRSSALWAGLNEVTCDYFGVQDDDDTLHPNHVQKCINTLIESSTDFVYTGVVKHEESPNVYFYEQNFAGSEGVVIKETRHLQFLDCFNQEKMIKFENYIQSNTWLASEALLDVKVLVDPRLVVAEDVYLYNLLMAKGSFVSIYSPTAEWNWRSDSNDNSMLGVAQNVWVESADRIRRRLKYLFFEKTIMFGEINALSGDPLAIEVVKRDVDTVKRFIRLNDLMSFNTLVPDLVRCTGISYPEEMGSWSNSKTVLITIPVKTQISRQSLFFVFTGLPAIHPMDPELILTVSTLDRDKIWIYDLSDTQEINRSIEIPYVLYERGEVALRFEFSNTFNPRRAGYGNDDRELAFLFKSIGLFESIDGLDAHRTEKEGFAPPKPIHEQGWLGSEAFKFVSDQMISNRSIDIGTVQLVFNDESVKPNNKAKLILENVIFDGVMIGSMLFQIDRRENVCTIEYHEDDNKSINLIRWDKISACGVIGKFIAFTFKISGSQKAVFISECNYRDVLWQRILSLIFLNLAILLERSPASASIYVSQARSEMIAMARHISAFAAEAMIHDNND